MLDFDFLVQVMTHLLQLCDENDWTQTGIPIEECVSVLEELFPRYVTNYNSFQMSVGIGYNNLLDQYFKLLASISCLCEN